MDYSEIYDTVAGLINRPELSFEIGAAIQRSTLKMHNLEFWKFDLVEKYIQLPQTAYLFQIDRTVHMPNYRQLCYIKNFNPLSYDSLTNTYTGSELQDYVPAEPNRLLNSYGNKLSDVFYTAGNLINVRSSTTVTMLLTGYYSRPTVSPVQQYKSWIAENYPFAIIDDAVAYMFKIVGLDDKMKKMESEVAVHIQLLKQNNLEEQSR